MPDQPIGARGVGVAPGILARDLPGEKAALRTALLARRRATPSGELARSDAAILRNLLASPLLAATDLVLTYLSMPGEVDTRALIRACHGRGLAVAAPRCVPGRRMAWHLLNDDAVFVRSRFGVDEPDPAVCPQVEPGPGALAVVPGLAFDQLGQRLGYGGGYYDRFLERFPGVSVGLARQRFICGRLACAEPHDVAVAWLADEHAVWKTGD